MSLAPGAAKPLVAVVMGSRSDWETMKNAAGILADFEVPHVCRIVSAHRTPDLMADFDKKNRKAQQPLLASGAVR